MATLTRSIRSVSVFQMQDPTTSIAPFTVLKCHSIPVVLAQILWNVLGRLLERAHASIAATTDASSMSILSPGCQKAWNTANSGISSDLARRRVPRNIVIVESHPSQTVSPHLRGVSDLLLARNADLFPGCGRHPVRTTTIHQDDPMIDRTIINLAN